MTDMTMQTAADYCGIHRTERNERFAVLYVDSLNEWGIDPGFYLRWHDELSEEPVVGPFETSREAYDDATGEDASE
jgi:hypothetical protein